MGQGLLKQQLPNINKREVARINIHEGINKIDSVNVSVDACSSLYVSPMTNW